MRLTIKTRLIAAFGAVLVLLGALAWVSITRLADSNTTMKGIVNDQAEQVRLANELVQGFLQLSDRINGHIIAPDQPTMDAIEKEIDQIRARNTDLMGRLGALVNEDGARLLAEIDRTGTELLASTDAVIEQSRLVTNERATELSFGPARETAVEMRRLLAGLKSSVAASPVVNPKDAESIIATLDSNVVEALLRERNAIILSDDAMIAEESRRSQSTIADMGRNLDTLDAIFGTVARSERAQLREQFENYRTVSAQVHELAAGNSGTRAQERRQAEILPQIASISEDAAKVVAGAQTAMDEAVKAADAAYAASRTMLLGVALLALAVGASAAVWISLSIGRGLGRAVEVARAVAIGDLTVDTRPTTTDEIGDLLGALGNMTGSLKTMTGVAERIAEGDLTVENRRRSDLDTLGIAFERMLAKLKDVITNANASADGVAQGAQAMSATSEQLSQGSTEQAAAAQEASSAMEEMSSNIRQSADNAAQTEKIATQSAQEAAESGKAVNEAVQAMKTIAEKINIIQEIARQTDLLALNAAVEAARAGQHGKGFAVVASEVRKLAERSQQAAQEIGTLSGRTVEVSERAGNMLSSLVPSIRRTADLVKEISAATREQNAGAEQINSAIRELDTVIQQNSSSATEASATSQELAAQSEQLRGVISFFKLDDGHMGTGGGGGFERRPVPRPARPTHATGSRPRPASAAVPRAAAAPAAAAGGIDLDLGSQQTYSDTDFERY